MHTGGVVLASAGRNIVWLEIMLKNSRLLLSVLLLGVAPGDLRAQESSQENQQQPQEEQPQQEQPEQEQPQEEEDLVKLPRVVGEARSQEEFEDWKTIEQTENMSEKAELAEQFLHSYPDSGLTAFAHHVLAEAAYQENDIENFIVHGEEVLLERPETPELLAPLASLYSEKRQIFKATDYANRALQLLDQLEKPGGVSSIEWVTQVHELRVSSYYALGRSQLESWRLSLSPEQLQEAIEHFNRTLELDPEHGYAAFRLGFAQLKARDPEAALEAYARATVLDGPAAEPSRSHLEKILTDLKKNSESKSAQTSIEQLLEEERKQLQAQLVEKEQKLNVLAAQVDSRELLSKEITPPRN